MAHRWICFFCKGEVAGSIIRQVLDIHADFLKPGSVLALKVRLSLHRICYLTFPLLTFVWFEIDYVLGCEFLKIFHLVTWYRKLKSWSNTYCAQGCDSVGDCQVRVRGRDHGESHCHLLSSPGEFKLRAALQSRLSGPVIFAKKWRPYSSVRCLAQIYICILYLIYWNEFGKEGR